MDFSLRGGGQDQKSGKSSQGRWHSLKLDGQSELYVARGEQSQAEESTNIKKKRSEGTGNIWLTMPSSVLRAHFWGGVAGGLMVDPPRKDLRLILRSLDFVLSACETLWPHHICIDSVTSVKCVLRWRHGS